MENTETPAIKVSIRTKVLQFVAIGLFILINIPYINKLIEDEVHTYIIYFSHIMLYGILALIASNKPTRISVALISFLSLICLFFYSNPPSSYGIFFIINLIISLCQLTIRLYMYGVVVRNNQLDNKSLISINVLFGIMLFQLILDTIIYLILLFSDSIMPLIITYRNCILIICNLVSCIAFFFFVRSAAFSGIYDNTQLIKGAYRFWNKYFKYYLIVFGITIILTIVIEDIIH